MAALLVIAGVIGGGAALYAHGYRVWVVHTGSMEPNYMPGDVVVDRPVTAPLHKGDVITFLHSDTATDVVTHRVVGITRAGLIHTKGDANRTADVWEIRPDQVQGKVAYRLRGLGFVLVFLRQPGGMAALVCSAVAIVLLWQLFFATPAGSDDEGDANSHDNSDDNCDDNSDDNSAGNSSDNSTVNSDAAHEALDETQDNMHINLLDLLCGDDELQTTESDDSAFTVLARART